MDDKFFQDLFTLQLGDGKDVKDVYVLTDPIAFGLREAIKDRLTARHVPENWAFIIALQSAHKTKELYSSNSKHEKYAIDAVEITTCRDIIQCFVASETAGNKEINISDNARKSLVGKANPTFDDFKEALKTVAALVRDFRNLTNKDENTEELKKSLSEIYQKDELIAQRKHDLIFTVGYIQSELKFAAEELEKRAANCNVGFAVLFGTNYFAVVNKLQKSVDQLLDEAKALPAEKLEKALQKILKDNHKKVLQFSAKASDLLKKRMEDLGNLTTVDQAIVAAKKVGGKSYYKLLSPKRPKNT